MIIQSLLDTDLYKFSMMQVVLHHFPGAMVEYRFKCRTPDVNLGPHAAEIRHQIRHLCSLRFQRDELDYLRTLRFLKGDFVDLLRLFQLDEGSIEVRETPSANGGLDIAIRGPWLHANASGGASGRGTSPAARISSMSGMMRSSSLLCRKTSRQPSRTARSGLPCGLEAATLNATGTTVSNLYTSAMS